MLQELVALGCEARRKMCPDLSGMHFGPSPWELLAWLVAWGGALVLTWWLFRACLIADIGGNLRDSPMRQFGVALLGAGIWLAVTCIATFYLAFYFPGVDFSVGASALAGTGIVWLVRRVLRWLHPSKVIMRENLRSTRRLQFSCQDLVVAALCYGLGMTLVASSGEWDRSELLLWCVVLIPTQLVALIALADVRRWLARPEAPASRIAASCCAHLFFLALVPAAVAGWLMWRSAHRQVLIRALQERS